MGLLRGSGARFGVGRRRVFRLGLRLGMRMRDLDMASLVVEVVIVWGCLTVRRLVLCRKVCSSGLLSGSGGEELWLGFFGLQREGLSFVTDGVKSVG